MAPNPVSESWEIVHGMLDALEMTPGSFLYTGDMKNYWHVTRTGAANATHPSVHCDWRNGTLEPCNPRTWEGNEADYLAWMASGGNNARAKEFRNVYGCPASIFPTTGLVGDVVMLSSLHYVIRITEFLSELEFVNKWAKDHWIQVRNVCVCVCV